MRKVIGVVINGEITFHAPDASGADYDTLCGIDANDPTIGHGGRVAAPKGQKINCGTCRTIYDCFISLKLRRSDFE